MFSQDAALSMLYYPMISRKYIHFDCIEFLIQGNKLGNYGQSYMKKEYVTFSCMAGTQYAIKLILGPSVWLHVLQSNLLRIFYNKQNISVAMASFEVPGLKIVFLNELYMFL